MLTILLILFTASFASRVSTAQSNEDLLYMTDFAEYGGISQSTSIVDDEGNLHIFFITRSALGNRLLHQFYLGDEQSLEVVIDNAQGIRIWETYKSNTTVGIAFSLISSSGENVFYHYHWDPSRDKIEYIGSIPSEYFLFYDIFIKIIFVNDIIHLFYTFVWGSIGQNKNLTHYYGYSEASIQNETFLLPYFDPLFQLPRDIVDIFINEDGDIWYLYQVVEENYGIGIYKIEGENFIFCNYTEYDNVFHTVNKVVTQPSSNSSEILTFSFITPYTVFWGDFNGTRTITYSQSVFYANPIDILLQINDGITSILVADYSETVDSINFYQGSLQSDQFGFSTIVSQKSIQQNHYSVSFSANDYIILFNKTLDPSDYKPGPSLRYREDQAIALFILSSIDFSIASYVENLEVYNPFEEFLQNKWYVLVIIGGIFVIALAYSIFFFIRRREKIKAFITDKQVGDHGKLVTFFLNIWRPIGNSFSLIFSIWFSNKKRSIITLAGFLITGYLLSSALIISQSEESAMIKAYDRSFPLIGDGTISVKLESTLTTTPSETYDVDAKEEIMSIYKGYEIRKYIEGIESSYYTKIKVENAISLRTFVSLPDDCDDFVFSTLIRGRQPLNFTEVLVKERTANFFNLDLNDTFTLTPAKKNVTVVGIYSDQNVAQTRRLANYLDLSHDIYNLFEIADILTENTLFFEFLSNQSTLNQDLFGYYQILTNFNKFKMAERTLLIEEQTLLNDRVFSFDFDSASSLQLKDELLNFFNSFNSYYLKNMARLLIFAVPAILLSIFMVFESSELFSSSYEKEIEILGNRGVRNRKLASVYLSIRLFEVVAAALLSFGIAVLTASPLIKINGFLRFNNPDTHLVIGNVGIELSLVMLILFVISVPRIIIIVSRKRKIEKSPNVFKKILKVISWRDLFFLGIGSGFFFFFYNETFLAYYESNASNFTIYLFLTIGGALFILLGGLPLVIKLLSTLWKIIGFILWRARKTKANFTFSEISKDIRYFENITLIFLLIVCILIPVMVVPYSKETILNDQALFMNGSDIKVENWNARTGMSIEEIEALDGVESVTHVKVHNMKVITIEVVSPLSFLTAPVSIVEVNTTNFLSTFYEPPSQLAVENWEKVGELDNNTIIMSEATMDHYFLQIGENYKFENVLMTLEHKVKVISDFNLFPVFYFEKDAVEESLMVVVNNECFEHLANIDPSINKITDEVYVRLSNKNAIDDVAREIYDKAGLLPKSYEDIKDSLKTPLYNIFIIEMILSLFVAATVLVFSSFTTAIKILEKRTIKHDIMKKLGLGINRIINMSAIQTMIAAVIPALTIGAVVGFLTVGPTLIQLNFGVEPFGNYILYPIALLVILFVGIPVLVYLGLNYFLRREFGKYSPTVME